MYGYSKVGCSTDVGPQWKKHDHRNLQNETILAPEDIEIQSGVLEVEHTTLQGCTDILEPGHLKSVT